MRVAIIGSRNFNNYELVVDTLKEYENNITLIVSGGAKGADTLGERWAKEKNKEVLIFHPDWNKYGKSAGIIRNKDIIENSDIVFAFWDGISKGTKNSIELSKKLNKEIKIIKTDLNKISKEIKDIMNIENVVLEIREILENKRKEYQLTFEEESHKYTMLGLDGVLTDNWPSVSKVMKAFYDEFPSEKKAFEMSGGDPDKTEELLNEWKLAGEYSTNIGSRVHFLLEKHSLEMFNYDKIIREPIFNCDAEQIIKSDSMITAGKRFLETMKERGAYLIDTEIVLGHPELGYTGQGDTGWLIQNKNKDGFGLIITDYKTNKEKNFITQKYIKPMKPPFEYLPNNALGHYNTQLPLYGKLLLKMLEGTKYENIKILGCIIVRLTDERDFIEYRVERKTIDTILDMDMKKYLTKLKK